MKERFLLVFAVAGVSVATLAVAQAALRPGQYEVTIEMRMPDRPEPMKVTEMECISAEEAADFFKRLRADVGAAGETCTLSDPVYSGNKVSWESDCEGDVSAKSEVTVTPDGFSGIIRTVSDGAVVPFNMTARWIGATCTDDGDDD